VTLGAVRHPFSSGVAFGHGEGRVGCDGGFFSSLSFPRKNAYEIPKKQSCRPLCNLFNFSHSSFNYYFSI